MTLLDDLAAIVIAAGPDRLAARALSCAIEQTPHAAELVVVHGGEEGVARARMHAQLQGRSAVFVRSDAASPGAARNAGVRRSTRACFLISDGSEALPSGYAARGLEALTGAPDAAFAAAAGGPLFGIVSTGSFPNGCIDAAALVGGPWNVAPPVTTRRAFDEVGGYDESLRALADWDFLLTLIAAGHRGVLLAGSGSRYAEDDVRLRESMRVGAYLPATRRILEKHLGTFRTLMPAAILERERTARALLAHEHALIERRRQALAKLNAQPRRRLTFADLRRTTPVSRNWGLERGLAIDRHYIHRFLAEHADDIRGDVLEMLDDNLTAAYGRDRVNRSDVLDIDPGNARATLVADLRVPAQLPVGRYDCFILTQTLHLIDDMPAALRAAYQALREGGVLLATLPCASMVAVEYGSRGDHWRVTEAGARALFEQVFDPEDLEIRAHGNVLTIAAFLYGLCCDDLDPQEFAYDDPAYPLIVTVRARKPVRSHRPAAAAPRPSAAAVLLYHRVADVRHDAHGLAVSPRAFRSQLEELRRSWRVLPLQTLVSGCTSAALPDRAVALAFDDGYLDNLAVVAPMLEELGLPATFFLTSESHDGERRFWWDVLEEVLLVPGAAVRCPAAIELRRRRERLSYDTSSASARRAAHQELYTIFKTSGPVVRDDLLVQLAQQTPVRLTSEVQRPMTAGEVRRLLECPLIEVGAHGMHHLSLTRLSPENCHREVSECRSALVRLIRRPVTSFAYPFGDVSPEAVDAVSAAGFEIAVTCEARGVRIREHPLRIPRVPGRQESGAELAARLAGLIEGVAVREGFEPSVGL